MGSFVKDAQVTIASGASLSDPVFIGGEFSLIGIEYPAAWDAADITFQRSLDGVNYAELLDDAGTAIKKTVTAGQARELDSSEFKTGIFVKVRSGTSDTPVEQTADRTFKLWMRRYISR